MAEQREIITIILLAIGLVFGILSLIGMILYNKRILKVDKIRTFAQMFLVISINFTAVGNLYIAPYIPVFRLNVPKVVDDTVSRVCPLWIVQKGLTTTYGVAALVAILAMIAIVSLVIGRGGCGWACPFGLIQDLLNKLRNLLHINPVEPSAKAHNHLKYLKYAFLFLIFMLALSIGIAAVWDSAAGALYTSYLPAGTTRTAPYCAYCPTPTTFYFLSVVFGGGLQFSDPVHYAMWPIIGVITVGPFLIPRFFCRYLCPEGAMTSLFSKVALLHLYKEHHKCTKCNACYSHCPMRVELVQDEDVKHRVNDLNCIMCGECVEHCYERALSMKVGPLTVYKGGKSWEKTMEETAGGDATLKK